MEDNVPKQSKGSVHLWFLPLRGGLKYIQKVKKKKKKNLLKLDTVPHVPFFCEVKNLCTCQMGNEAV